MGWVSFVVLGLPLESFSDRLHSRCKLFFDLRMNPDADTQDLAGIYQLEAAVFVQNADYTFAMMSAASGCDQVALVNLDKTKRVTGDVLMTYLIHPGTAFYAGFTNTRENLALLGGPPTFLERTRQPSLTTGRQFFVKISYLFRM